MKILNEFTLKNLKLNKSRTIVTIVGIMLSCALITVVVGMAVSARKTLINSQINVTGKYDLYIEEAHTNVYKNAKANRNVESVYVRRKLGCAYMPQARLETKPYINVVGFSKKAYTDCFNFSLAEGRLPKSESELVLSQSVLEYSKADYKVGDTITLDLGKRVFVSDKETPVDDTFFFQNDGGYETLVNTQKKTYTIVGIFKDIASTYVAADAISASCSAFTLVNVYSDNDDLFVKYTKDGEKNYNDTSISVLNYSNEEAQNVYGSKSFEGDDFSIAYINYGLLLYQGFTLSEQFTYMLLSFVAIIIVIIMIASIFVIRNSFAISINEKTKLYGMLASVGATSKQIRHNVLYEAFVLGAIGIPLGLILGIGVITLLVIILNALMGDMLNGSAFVYSVPWWCVLASIGLTAIIILFSSISSAIRASKISPITAIRNNNDIKLDKKSKKSYKSPKLVKKLFGVGGEIAYKNLKRSKKKYRTTVISIIVTVAMFISISTFVEYGLNIVNDQIEEMPYNLLINKIDDNNYEEFENIYNKISKVKGVESITNCYISQYSEIVGITDYYTDEAKVYYSRVNNNAVKCAEIVAVDDKAYKTYVEELGYNYEEVKDKALVVNKLKYYDEDDVLKNCDIFNLPKDLNVKIYPDGIIDYTEEEIGERLKNDPDFVADKCFDIQIVGAIDKEIPNSTVSYILNNVADSSNTILLVSDNSFKEMFENTFMKIMINSSDATKTLESIKKLDISGLDYSNYEETAKQQSAILLIFAIFAYGFVVVISLIGITNVFNTINTNMRLRSKEFAMLKSIGMTKKEFNRMIRLESLFYGFKSLVIGIPLGLLGGYAIFRVTGNAIMVNYSFPTIAVLISIVFVLSVIWLIMRVSISNVNKQNIIETIRNDNI